MARTLPVLSFPRTVLHTLREGGSQWTTKSVSDGACQVEESSMLRLVRQVTGFPCRLKRSMQHFSNPLTR